MNLFAQRSDKTELIDAPDLSFKDWSVCLNELNTINTWLGGHAITTAGVRKLIGNSPVTIAEIGCGGGDNLKAIARSYKGLPIKYIGIDLNKACVDFARENCKDLPDATFIHSDYRLADFGKTKPDIIFSSLFCHHFTDAQLTEMLVWLKQHSTRGFFINDLHRHPVAYHLIKWITCAFSGSYLVKNDAPVSVLRGFKRNEWETLMCSAGIEKYNITWKWAFRHLITVKNE